MLRSMPTKVVSADVAPPPPVSKKIAKKNATPADSGAATPIPEGHQVWEVVLSDTVIFPAGGGQPSDTGSITFKDPNGAEHTFPVEMCIRKGLIACHRVVVPQELVFVVENSPGSEVVVATDWEVRMDHVSLLYPSSSLL